LSALLGLQFAVAASCEPSEVVRQCDEVPIERPRGRAAVGALTCSSSSGPFASWPLVSRPEHSPSSQRAAEKAAEQEAASVGAKLACSDVSIGAQPATVGREFGAKRWPVCVRQNFLWPLTQSAHLRPETVCGQRLCAVDCELQTVGRRL